MPNKSRIAINKDDAFQDKLFGGGILLGQRNRWQSEAERAYFPELSEKNRRAGECAAYAGLADFGHTSPNSRLLLEIGFSGLLCRIAVAEEREGLTEKQKTFYESCRIVLSSMMTVAKRLSEAIAPYNAEGAEALANIAVAPPSNIYEAMQLLVLYFFMHEYVAGTRVRTLGRLDVLLYPFFKRDIASGRFTKEDIKELLRYFLSKFSNANVDYGLPFCLSGIDADGNDVTNEMSYLIVEIYRELDVISPKIHIRVSDKSPKDFVKLVLSAVCDGISSFVFTNDALGVDMLKKVGIEERDARDYVPIGCYEPAVWGVEIGCTGNGHVNLPKAIELVMNGGKDLATGTPCGVFPKKIENYGDFLSEIYRQLDYMIDEALRYVVTIEHHYDKINPDPILSSQYDESVRRGVDVYEGGAKYNNSSIYLYNIASLVDGVLAVKKLVFDERRYTLDELLGILAKNWQGNERLRAEMLRDPVKYGNADRKADALAAEIAAHCAALITNQPNGRDGVFKEALFSINHCFVEGLHTMATPDGRRAGDPLSKNLSAVTSMDKHGVTALIRSVTEIDLSAFPTGSVLDIVLHPSAVKGEGGLEAFYGLLMTYFARGGYAMHGNVFVAEDLKRAKENPEAYKNLQVRVCGWNAYFVKLSPAEQDAFIAQAENTI